MKKFKWHVVQGEKRTRTRKHTKTSTDSNEPEKAEWLKDLEKQITEQIQQKPTLDGFQYSGPSSTSTSLESSEESSPVDSFPGYPSYFNVAPHSLNVPGARRRVSSFIEQQTPKQDPSTLRQRSSSAIVQSTDWFTAPFPVHHHSSFAQATTPYQPRISTEIANLLATPNTAPTISVTPAISPLPDMQGLILVDCPSSHSSNSPTPHSPALSPTIFSPGALSPRTLTPQATSPTASHMDVKWVPLTFVEKEQEQKHNSIEDIIHAILTSKNPNYMNEVVSSLAALELTRHSLDAQYASSTTAMVLVNVNSIVLWSNRALTNMFLLSPSEMLGLSTVDVLRITGLSILEALAKQVATNLPPVFEAQTHPIPYYSQQYHNNTNNNNNNTNNHNATTSTHQQPSNNNINININNTNTNNHNSCYNYPSVVVSPPLERRPYEALEAPQPAAPFLDIGFHTRAQGPRKLVMTSVMLRAQRLDSKQTGLPIAYLWTTHPM